VFIVLMQSAQHRYTDTKSDTSLSGNAAVD